MDYFFLIDVLGGLGLFFFGIHLLGTGLEQFSGGRLERALEKISGNLLKAVLLGALVTAAVQSSTTTTILVVGLVNANILKLKQAVGVIMGANIGTTVTAHLLRLTSLESDNPFLRLIEPESLASIACLFGVVLMMHSAKNKRKQLGQILMGFSILFAGMLKITQAVEPLRELPAFGELFAKLSNPLLGVLAGAAVTFAVQSSAGSIGILQALAATGAIRCSTAFPIIMGQNIGTCITPLLSSVGASRNAKRAACVHLTFNILGTVIFLTAAYAIQYTVGFSFWNNPIDAGGIATFHTVFNVTVTLLLLPFAGLLEKLVTKIIPGGGEEEGEGFQELDARFLVSPGLALEHAKKAVACMARKAHQNYLACLSLFGEYSAKRVESIEETEEVLDRLEDKVEAYLLQLSSRELRDEESRGVSRLLQISGEFERVGDYSINLMECAQRLYESSGSFSEEAMEEMGAIGDAVEEILSQAIRCFEDDNEAAALGVEPLEEVIDEMEGTLKDRHIDRLRGGLCSVDAGYCFLESLSNLERIADHCSNVAIEMISQATKTGELDRHEYRRTLHEGQAEYYNDLYREYSGKYLSRLQGAGV